MMACIGAQPITIELKWIFFFFFLILKINVFVFLYQNHVNVLFSSHKTKCDTKVGSRKLEPTDFNQY